MISMNGDKQTASLADMVFEKIEDDILSEKIPAGTVLTELKISENIGVSRTPVREALRRLEQEGLVEATANKSTVVLGITKKDICDIFEIRKRIEGLAAHLAAERITEDELEKLIQVVDLQEYYTAKGDYDRIKNMDSQFHELIYAYSGSKVLMTTLSMLHHRIMRYRKLSISISGRAAIATSEHREILNALIVHDAEKAERLTIEHAQKALDNLLSKIKE